MTTRVIIQTSGRRAERENGFHMLNQVEFRHLLIPSCSFCVCYRGVTIIIIVVVYVHEYKWTGKPYVEKPLIPVRATAG